MSKALIIVNAKIKDSGKVVAMSPVTEKMVAGLKKAIHEHSGKKYQVDVVAAASLWASEKKRLIKLASDRNTATSSPPLYCPLTIQLPQHFKFPQRHIFHACKDIRGCRDWVNEQLGYPTCAGEQGFGDRWLPMILTPQGLRFGRVIGEGIMPNSYQQANDLSARQRQTLHHLGDRLLESLSALPAVYLLQFSIQDSEIIFDRLWPFPAAPAIVSLGAQPDLFACHWFSLLERPIEELVPTSATKA